MKVELFVMCLVVLLLGTLSSAQAQEDGSVINGVVYDTLHQTYYVSYYVGTGETAQLVMIRGDDVLETELKNTSLLVGQKVHYVGSPDSYKKGGYIASTFIKERSGDRTPSFALVDKEGKTLDRVSRYALGDWTKRSKRMDMERTDVKVGKTEIKKVYQDTPSGKVVMFFNISEADAPAIVSVAEQAPYKKLFEIPIRSPGKYKISVGHISSLRDIEADIYDANRSKTLATKSSIGDHPSRISGLTYSSKQNLVIVSLDLEKPSILKVYDSEGRITQESSVQYPRSDAIWIIQPEKTEFSRVDLLEVEGGEVLSSVNVWDATRSNDRTMTEFFLQLYQYDTPAEGIVSAVYTIPKDYTNPEVIEFSKGTGATIRPVNPGIVCSWSRIGAVSPGDYVYVIVLDNGKIKSADIAYVVNSTWGLYLHKQKINIDSPGLQGIIKEAIRY